MNFIKKFISSICLALGIYLFYYGVGYLLILFNSLDTFWIITLLIASGGIVGLLTYLFNISLDYILTPFYKAPIKAIVSIACALLTLIVAFNVDASMGAKVAYLIVVLEVTLLFCVYESVLKESND